ncbi:putative Prion inhibition and propagation [Trypanosoma vivax]|nr:putative Prion inhibition and propagation [Trypanosoma vivax]KAH8606598.1 putative Prion inhibition and propagation [Trypanosoma vivax]KAH8606605.1 putative Prion inhibition and propagation [Trypanosoma vivax]
MIETRDECKSYTEKYSASIRLSSYAEKLDEMNNLIEWKNEMVKLVGQTHKEAKSSAYSRKLWTLKDGEKVKEVVQAIRNLTDKLVITLELLETVRVSVDEANKTVNSTVNSMENVNKTMLSALEGNGTLLSQLVDNIQKYLHSRMNRKGD